MRARRQRRAWRSKRCPLHCGLTTLLGRSILHSGKSTVVYWEEEPDYDVYALLRADVLQFVESRGTIL
jgi:hypothetical protein